MRSISRRRAVGVLSTTFAIWALSFGSAASASDFDSVVLRFEASPFGSTVAYLDNVPDGCVYRFDTTASGDEGAIAIDTSIVLGPCYLPPPGTTSLHIDLGVQPPGTYQVDWHVKRGGYEADWKGSFSVSPPLAKYVTPACPFETCFGVGPSQPLPTDALVLTFDVDSASYPQCMEVLDPAVTVQDNVIRVSGKQTPRPGCVASLPPAVHGVSVMLPPLALGNYSAVLQLDGNSPDQEVSTINGKVAAGIIMIGEFSVVTPEQSSMVDVVEYYYPPYDHYFLTASPSEIALLDAQTPPFQEWVRTGYKFKMYRPDVGVGLPAKAADICRFYNDSFAPRSSHFYAARGFGCEQTLEYFPDWKLETDSAFIGVIPEENGECSQGFPLYRVYNNGMGGAPNHRFLVDWAERERMVALGWIPEGYGVGVAMCGPT